ncbi:hypothetical protein AB1Y20_022828 [Prymnesium parvum]|uniref:Uncharacterized protein n=1 Tax=Prymnesium parvum TaxID=97485 RepID=A0AB34JEX2_PRYPA
MALAWVRRRHKRSVRSLPNVSMRGPTNHISRDERCRYKPQYAVARSVCSPALSGRGGISFEEARKQAVLAAQLYHRRDRAPRFMLRELLRHGEAPCQSPAPNSPRVVLQSLPPLSSVHNSFKAESAVSSCPSESSTCLPCASISTPFLRPTIPSDDALHGECVAVPPPPTKILPGPKKAEEFISFEQALKEAQAAARALRARQSRSNDAHIHVPRNHGLTRA